VRGSDGPLKPAKASSILGRARLTTWSCSTSSTISTALGEDPAALRAVVRAASRRARVGARGEILGTSQPPATRASPHRRTLPQGAPAACSCTSTSRSSKAGCAGTAPRPTSLAARACARVQIGRRATASGMRTALGRRACGRAGAPCAQRALEERSQQRHGRGPGSSARSPSTRPSYPPRERGLQAVGALSPRPGSPSARSAERKPEADAGRGSRRAKKRRRCATGARILLGVAAAQAPS
jgi:hypothetical protein